MAGWFYLSGRETPASSKQEEEKDQETSNFFLYNSRSNEEIYNTTNKGFEIWPQYYQQQQNVGNYSTPSRRSYSDESLRSGFLVMRHGGSIGAAAGGGVTNCQDCGNKAKKDCEYLRCRACCKSRGFQCQTHFKSTWVPAATRRERQQQLAAAAAASSSQQQNQNEQQNQQLQFRGENYPKRLKDSQGVCTRLATTTTMTNSAGLEVSHFPPEVNSPAVFRCVKVSSFDEPDLQIAYQAAVNIGGHVFKGILYDQGVVDPRYTSGETSGGEGQQLNLITTATTTTTNTGNQAAGALIDPSSLYTAPLNAFIAGTQFFPPQGPS